MLELAHKRVEELKKEFPKAHAVDPDDVRVIYVITDDRDKVRRARRRIADSKRGRDDAGSARTR